MRHRNITHPLVLAALLAVAAATTPAHAQVNFTITIAPPAAQYEPIPALAPGYVWAPGYWAWYNDRYIWLHGRAIVQRQGYRWEPDRWTEGARGYVRQSGRWEHDQNRGQHPKHDTHEARLKQKSQGHNAGKHRDHQSSRPKKDN